MSWKYGVLSAVAIVALGLSACGGEAANGEEAQVAEQAPSAEMTAEPAEAMPQELPAGVTEAMIGEGKTIFTGAGICMSCHGAEGKGIPNLGANLTDGEWLHSDGSYEGIVQSITNGVTAQESGSGVPMPAKGGTSITEDQVKAVAAYVWSLSK